MKLSTKGRYGTRLMLELAIHYGKGPVALKDIAKRQEISEKYLWQLISPLKIAGLVNSTRGPSGGYTLAKKPSEITLNDIVSVLDGPLCIVDCVKDPSLCKRSANCVTREVWSETSEELSKVLASKTLEDMIKRQKNKDSPGT